jgi:para-nitrobenzyl esterase
MKPVRWTILFAGALLAAAQTDPVVSVTGGQIRGRLTSGGGAAFKAIPYARPPVGDLRWRDPQPVTPWQGVREADQFARACTQISEGWNARYVTGSGEDCLYLNVSTAEWPPQPKHPVMLWIHGGSNTAGSGEAAGFDRRTMVHHGLVLVTINYRLGALGFMAHPELDRESPHHTSGDYGLMDQLAALHWVRDNIAEFGGDSANVTVAGQSAGSYDISLLLTSPLAKGLFQRAIAESGATSGFKGSLTAARAQEAGRALAAQLNAPETGAIEFLRAKSPEEILTAANATRRVTGIGRDGLETSIDGYVLPKSPTEVFAAGGSLRVPLIVGSQAQETGGPNNPAQLRETIRKAYGGLADAALKLYGLAGDGTGQADALYGGIGAQWSTDTGFRCPATAEALGHAAGAQPTYRYEFEHAPPGRQATSHSSELNFLFATWPANTQLSDMDRLISQQAQDYWANFARSGDPNGKGLPAWPKFTAKGQEYLAFTDSGAASKAGLRRAFCEVFMESLKLPPAK